MKVRWPVKYGAIALGLFLAYQFGLKPAMQSGLIDKVVPRAVSQPSTVPPKAELPDLPNADRATAPSVPSSSVLPAANTAPSNSKEVRAEVWAWNGQIALLLANGGSLTTSNSPMAKHGVANLRITRNDDTPQMQANLVTCANEAR